MQSCVVYVTDLQVLMHSCVVYCTTYVIAIVRVDNAQKYDQLVTRFLVAAT